VTRHVDHILPLALGGDNRRKNIQLLCPTCNLSKGAHHPIDHAQRNGLLL
jgi:5-methylcytosine-specific restriction endonuclease McrA